MQLSIKTLSLAVLCAASLSLQAQTLSEKADMHYELHAYRLAAQNYETILARDPEETLVANKLADAYYHLNDLQKAAKWYAVALRSNALKTQSVLQYGKVLMMLGKYDEAAEQFKRYRATNTVVADNYLKASQFAKQTEDNMPDMNVAALSKANTATSDFGVTLFGDKMIWSSSRTDLKRGETSAKAWSGAESNQLFSAPIEGVSTQPFKVSFLKSDFKNGMNESHVSFSEDGKSVAFMRNNLDDGERISSSGGMELSIFTAEIDAQGNWRDVKAFPYNGTGYSTGFPSLSPDGKTLYFASNRPNGQGGFDIYSCQKRGMIWGEPRNMGSDINTVGDDITPFTDGKTFYFASDYHIGYGGFDVFSVGIPSGKTDGVGNEIVNLGTGVNSAGDDFGFVFDPSVKVGFFTSNRAGGKGKEDIYRVDKPSETANIVILDNGSPIKNTKVSVSQGNAQSLSQLKSGNWLLDLNDKKTYTLEVKKEGFKTKTVKIEPEFVKKSRIVEVNLEREVPVQMNAPVIPEYKGRVFDASNEDGLEGVLVRATNQENNVQMETLTDKNGRFKFNLSATNTYLITYSKEGFVIGKKSVKTADLKTKIIGEFSLIPSAVSDKNALVASVEPDKKTIARPAAIPIAYNEVTVKTTEIPVFAIQLMVTGNENILNLSQYDDLKTVGNIYIVPESGTQKVRLGIYKSQAEADAAMKKVLDLGYKSTYVVQEKNARAVENNIFTPLPKPVQPRQTKPKPLPQPKKQATTPKNYNTTAVKDIADDKTFKVKIAAMKNAEWFDDSKVGQIWKIDQVKQGDITLFIMDGIKTLQQAKDIKAKVKTAGYKDAKVVVKDGNKYKVVD